MKFLMLILVAFSCSCFAMDNEARCVSTAHLDSDDKNICEKSDKKFLLLEFFSANCGHCRRNAPLMKRLEEETKTSAHTRLVSINSREQALQFKTDFALNSDIALDEGRRVSRAFEVTGVPILFVLDRNNNIVFTKSGVLNEESIQRVKELVQQEN